MTVHGELAVLPAVQRGEAAKALAQFTDAYNAADKAYDPALDANRVTGALGAINQAGLKARSVTSPDGNAGHQDLELTDPVFTIPKKAGWPRWFVAVADSNRDRDSGPGDNSWVLVFLRHSVNEPWQAAYLTILSPDEIPKFKTDKDGWAQPVPADSTATTVPPEELSGRYASYLKSGQPDTFAKGPHTDGWRADRAKDARLPGLTTQYIDQPVTGGDFEPLGLATEDGGALVFFTTRFFERQTAAKGYRPKVSADVAALMTGEVTNTVTQESVSSAAVYVPKRGADPSQVIVAGRLQGITGAKGS